jgi:hypothetical protein
MLEQPDSSTGHALETQAGDIQNAVEDADTSANTEEV